jgi:hypothetical protein
MNITLSYGEVEIKKAKAKLFFINFGKLIKLLGELDLGILTDQTVSDEDRGSKIITLLVEKVVLLTDNYDEAIECINNVLGGLITTEDLEVEDVIVMVKSIFDLYDFQNIMSLISSKKK